MQAFCLAAGLGTRLRPITHHIPKPLFPILGEPNLTRIIRGLTRLGAERIVINACHLREKIRAFVRSRHPHCILSLEEKPLGTGGGLLCAQRYFDLNVPILIVNSDIVFDFPLDLLLNYHVEKGGFATLLLTNYRPFNLVVTDGDRVVNFSKEASAQGLCFTGISVIEPRFHSYCPGHYPFSLVDLWKTAMAKGEKIHFLLGEATHSGFYWQDIGTPLGYLKAHSIELLRGSGHGGDGSQWNWIGKGAVIPPGTHLSRCIVWDNSVIEHPGHYTDTIFTPFGILIGEERPIAV